jgi:uncharacterized protein (TIGR00255 family)
MTGYGRGVAERGIARVTVELRSVNHRFLDLKIRGAASPAVEDAVSQRVRERLERGAVSGTIRVERTGPGAAVRIDRTLAQDIHAQLAALAADLGLPAPGLRDVIAQPGVLSIGDPSGEAEADAAAAATIATATALDALVAMREAEGANLAADMRARLDAMGRIFDALGTATVDAGQAARDRLHERVSRLLEATGGTLDPARLAQEIAVLADRADVTEEQVRARSHLGQLGATLAQTGGVGRRLDFLVQELGREINTIGAKSTAAAIAQLVVDAKTELEKIREQVQNLE